MAIAKDALSTSNLASYTHTPVGTPRGVLVMIPNESATDQVTGVTYGGVAMTEIALSPLLASGSEGGGCYGYFLGSSVPTGPQTVAATISVGSPHIITMTVTADTDTEIVDTSTINETAVTGDRTGTLSTGGRTTVVVEVGWCSTSAPTSITQLTGWTAHNESDEGAEVNFRYSYDTVGTSDVTFGVTVGGTEDVAVLAAAIGEVVSGSTYTLDADSATYTYSATAAGLEFDRLLNAEAASYTYTASAAGLEFDRQLVAEAAAYTWTANDASLEYTPIGSTYTLDGDSAAYLWSATDADLVYVQLTHYSLDADAAAYVWTANDAGLEYSGAETDTPPTYGNGQATEQQVRNWWNRIDRLRAENRERESAEREQKRVLEARRRTLAELPAKPTKRAKAAQRALAAERESIQADIAAAESQAALLQAAIDTTTAEIERIQAEMAALFRRRNAALALMLMSLN